MPKHFRHFINSKTKNVSLTTDCRGIGTPISEAISGHMSAYVTQCK